MGWAGGHDPPATRLLMAGWGGRGGPATNSPYRAQPVPSFCRTPSPLHLSAPAAGLPWVWKSHVHPKTGCPKTFVLLLPFLIQPRVTCVQGTSRYPRAQCSHYGQVIILWKMSTYSPRPTHTHTSTNQQCNLRDTKGPGLPLDPGKPPR